MAASPTEKYVELMFSARKRFDAIASRTNATFRDCELSALDLRKIVEALVFGCIVAAENGFKFTPRDITGAYNAQEILRRLEKKGMIALPSPSAIRQASAEEALVYDVKTVIDGIPTRRISIQQLVKIYTRCHSWLHLSNPYSGVTEDNFFERQRAALIADADAVRLFLEAHVIGIKGAMFFCVLWDKVDNQTKVLPLSKTSEAFQPLS